MAWVQGETFDLVDATYVLVDGFTNNGATIAIQSPGVFGTGNYLSVSSSSSSASFDWNIPTGPITAAAIYTGRIFIDNTLPGVTLWTWKDAGGVVQATLSVTGTGQLSYVTGAHTYLSAASLVSVNGWYSIAAKVTQSATTSGALEIKIGPNDAISVSSSITTVNGNGFQFWCPLAFGNGPVWYDDLNIVTVSGGNNTGFLGDVYGFVSMPSNVGNVNQWTPTGAASTWQAVNQIPPDGDTTYIADATVGHENTFLHPAVPAGVNAVYAIQTKAVARRDASGARSIEVGIGNGSAQSYGSSTALTSSYAYYPYVADGDPNNSSASWTTTSANAAEPSIKVSA